ncbi:MAG TPA: ABC transporter ATP-binding protein [Terriglobales bacterium]|nr:ABC transporter ATP-binding protein [Terriglobales bacterium]
MSVASIIWTHLVPNRRAAQARSGVWTRVLRQVRPLWSHLALIVVLCLASAPLAMLLPLPLKIAVDSVLGKQAPPAWMRAIFPASIISTPVTLLYACAGVLLAVCLVMQAQALASWILQTYAGERMVHEFRAHLFWHVQRLNIAYHEHRGSAATSYRIQHDAPTIQYVTIQGLVPLISASASFLGMLYITARLDRTMALIAVLLSPLVVLMGRSSSRRVHDRWHQVKELDSSAMAVMDEVLSSVRVVKAFGRETAQDERFQLRSSRRMWGQVKLAWVQAGFHTAIGLTVAVGSAAALLVGVAHVRSGVLSLGSLLIVMSYMAQVYEPLRTVSTKLPELQSWLVSLERAFALLDEIPEIADAHQPPEMSEPQHARAAARAVGELEFDNVTFGYREARPVLSHVSFSIPAGTRVGIVGRTGSGKSTLINLLTRFYEVDSGSIRLDGVDLRDYRLSHLRDQYSIVMQEPVLFSTTVAENIAFGRPNATQEEIVAAAQAANAHDFIEKLPRGYETVLGDRGTGLSGGERQRISLARAFLKDAPILILDEATSAVDVRTEAKMLESIEKLIQGRTTFMIAHRLGTLRNCDLLLTVEDGEVKVVEEPVDSFLEHLVPGSSAAVVAAGIVN